MVAAQISVGMRSIGRYHIVLLHDITMAILSIVLAFYLRLDIDLFVSYIDSLLLALLIFTPIAGTTFWVSGTSRGMWRHASLPELQCVVQSVTVAVLIFFGAVLTVNRLDGATPIIPRSIPVIQWFVLVILLGGSRFSYRLWRNGNGRWVRQRHRTAAQIPVLLVGACENAALFIRAMKDDPNAPYRVVGILDDEPGHLGRSIQGVPVLGMVERLDDAISWLKAQGLNPQKVIAAEEFAGGRRLQPETLRRLFDRAESRGVTVARLPGMVELKEAVNDGASGSRFELRRIALEDLLARPRAVLDRAAIGELIAGRRLLITGAGGSIGSELARQIAALGPAELVLLDHSECNLYSIDLEISERHSSLACRSVLSNIRTRGDVAQIFAQHRPELVFHAAALKHVPMVELNPREGILTNVLGTRYVADAANRYGALAFVQISTDKAVNPTSVMGATKRLAELYCQSLDLTSNSESLAGDPPSPRFITVRFGNVLGSSGSVVPLFQRQLAHGGPLTVTHPEITRYFMTTREAVELVLHASARSLRCPAEERGRIFVLDMGEPVKIVDLARRMIQLAGLRPDDDVGIEFTGLRPGEKLYEELFDEKESRLLAAVDGVHVAASRAIELEVLRRAFDEIAVASQQHDDARLWRLITHLLPSYRPPRQGGAGCPDGRRKNAPAALKTAGR